jgi:uncharacterized protein
MADAPHTNALIHEKSPYLLQHAHNPVNWLPWGDAAIAKAKAEGKPILLSSGYSTCHWCHVMEHESFEDEAVAAVMNEKFICIKLDREERPDIDLIYMTYVQAATGGGGWPMNVFLTPELKPFYGGTYFPKESKGRIGWVDLLKEISKIWEEDTPGVLERAAKSVEKLQEHLESELTTAGDLPALNDVQHAAYDSLSGSFDYHEGGFSSAPKFPRPSLLLLLTRIHHLQGTKDESQSNWALEMVLRTLRAMANGGLRDHLGGGFHRYSVDSYWHVPHFEKMLYDQGQLLMAYAEGAQLSAGSDYYQAIGTQIVSYLQSCMMHPEGAFYSAEDADSLATAEAKKKTEGAYYVWTAQEVDELLGKRDGGIFRYAYGIRKDGNARPESDPHEELKGLNTLFRAFSAKKAAEYFKTSVEEVEALLVKGRALLLEARAQRPRPHLDDKIITAWNGLIIGGLAKAGAALAAPSMVAMAERAAQFLHDKLCKQPGSQLLRSWRDGSTGADAFAIDYACLIDGLIHLHQTTLDARWLTWAVSLQAEMDVRYEDPDAGGYFSVHTGMTHSVMRIKEDYDGAEPSPNALSALNLVRLSALTQKEAYAEKATRICKLFQQALKESSSAVPYMVMALQWLEQGKRQVVIAGDRDAEDFKAMLGVLHQRFLPFTVILHAGSHEHTAAMTAKDGKATAYVCQDYSCQAPITDIDTLALLR